MDSKSLGPAYAQRLDSCVGSLWANPGRLRLGDINSPAARRRLANQRQRPASASAAPASSPRSISSPSRPFSAKAERSDGGLLQYQLAERKLNLDASPQEHAEVEHVEPCSDPDHAGLCDSIYIPKCGELRVKPNSGIIALLSRNNKCICQDSEGINFKNLLLGNRGILSVLPLFDCMQSLKSLSLVGNGLRDAGIRSVTDALKNSNLLPQLSVFDLSHNPLSPPSADVLQLFLEGRIPLLFLGLVGTSLGNTQRQRLLRQCLAKMDKAQALDVLEAGRLAESSSFADLELRTRCAPQMESVRDLVIAATPRPPSAPWRRPQVPAGPAPSFGRKAAGFSPPFKVADPEKAAGCSCANANCKHRVALC